jgi:hypothetical protein
MSADVDNNISWLDGEAGVIVSFRFPYFPNNKNIGCVHADVEAYIVTRVNGCFGLPLMPQIKEGEDDLVEPHKEALIFKAHG